MQKRFCYCGHMVLVRYECRRGVWTPQVVSGKKVQRRSEHRLCPSCGAPLNIHTLR